MKDFKEALWEIIRNEGIVVNNQNLDWLLDRAEKLLINENKSNNFDVKSNEELFKQALVEGVNRRIDRDIEEAKKMEQIEEMAKVIINTKNDVKVWERLKTDEDIAEAFYNAGYRKQSEWISVEDRLPDCEWGAESEAVLFITKQGTMYTGYYGCGGIYRDRYFREYKNSTDGYDISFITHWMPLPEAPKMTRKEDEGK